MNSFWAGWLLGICGLMPFVHVNLLLQGIPDGAYGENAAVFATALSFSHLAFSTFPALMLYSVDAGQLALPLQGRQKNPRRRVRVILATLMASTALSVASLPLLEIALPWAYAQLFPYRVQVLTGVIAAFLLAEREWKRMAAGAGVFAFSGLAGWGIFEWGNLHQPLFPLLAGLFAVPTLVLGESPLEQEPETDERISWNWLGAGVLLGAASTLVPALSTGTVIALAFLFLSHRPTAFVSMAYAVTASKTFFDFVAAFSFGKARSAAAALAQSSASSPASLAELGLAALSALALAAAVGSWGAFPFIQRLARGNPARLRQTILVLLVGLCAAWEGPAGIAALVASGAAGLLGTSLGVKRSYGVGALMVPAWLHLTISV